MPLARLLGSPKKQIKKADKYLSTSFQNILINFLNTRNHGSMILSKKDNDNL
jgi:hypothetical protein